MLRVELFRMFQTWIIIMKSKHWYQWLLLSGVPVWLTTPWIKATKWSVLKWHTTTGRSVNTTLIPFVSVCVSIMYVNILIASTMISKWGLISWQFESLKKGKSVRSIHMQLVWNNPLNTMVEHRSSICLLSLTIISCLHLKGYQAIPKVLTSNTH